MGRKRRELIDGASYHVTARTNNRLFYLERVECKKMFLRILKETQKMMKCTIEGFTIMSNHIHLIVKTKNIDDLPKIMHRLLMTFAKRFNKRYKQTGHLWECRYFSRALKTFREIKHALSYVLMNPVKAELVQNPIDWAWSSLAFYKRRVRFFAEGLSGEVHDLYKMFCYVV